MNMREKNITLGLIAINIVFFIISAFSGDLLYNKGAFSLYYLLYGREWWRLIISMFLHADINHLVGNMLLLYLSGEIVEKNIGKWRFLLLYFFSGIMGSFMYAAYEWVKKDFVGSIGASGAVFGLVGALLVLVVYYKGQYGDITLGRVLFMIVYMIYTGLRTTYVNNMAHIGGLLGGILLMGFYMLMRRRSLKEQGGTHED